MLPRNGVSSSINILTRNHCMAFDSEPKCYILNGVVTNELFFFLLKALTELSHTLGRFPNIAVGKIRLSSSLYYSTEHGLPRQLSGKESDSQCR